MPALGVEDEGIADTRIASNGAVAEEAVEETAETPLIEDVDISTKQFRYNPSMHSANRPVRVDFGRADPKTSLNEYFDERGAPVSYAGGWEKNLEELRLGRIIQDKTAMGAAAELKSRWGFRFLYNPTTISTSASRVDSFYIDPRSASNRVVSGINQNFQTISFQVLLDRVPDLMADNLRDDDYSPRLRAGDKKGLLKYGTHWDLEALFRVCNGVWDLKDMGKTGNIGVLFPANARLLLGKENYFGFIQGVSYTDVMFTYDMIPVRTRVDITFRRHVDIAPGDVQAFLDRFPSSLIGSATEDEDSGDSSGTGSDANAPSGDAPTPSGSQVWSDPSIPHGGHSGGKVTNATNYMFNQIWSRFGDGFTSVQCWRANGYGSPDHPGGHACDFVVSQGFATGSAKAHGDAVADYAMRNAKALGICYIIWWNRIWNARRDPVGGWRELGRGGDASNQHKDHVHISSLTSEDGGCS